MYDLVIIGAGPGGYVAALRAGQNGLKTAIIDKQYIGGMCLNWGCIPTKAMLENARVFDQTTKSVKFGVSGIDPKGLTFDWQKSLKRIPPIVKKLTKGVEFLLKKNGVEVIRGEAAITSPNQVTVENRLLETKNIIIATGSKPEELPYEFPKNKIIELENLLSEVEIPENLLIYGNGAVAVEIAQIFSLINKKVTIINPANSLIPQLDVYLESYLTKELKKKKIDIVEKDHFAFEKGELLVEGEKYDFDKIINCSWRKGVIPDSKPKPDLENGYIKVSENLETSIPSVYAIGDVNGLSYLAHSASAQGLFAVNKIQGIKADLDFKMHPINIYSIPEIAQIGLTEAKVKEQGIEYKISEFSLSSNGKALTEANVDGFVRIIFETKYGEVLGVQMVARNATDMIAEAATLMKIEGTVYDIAATVHAHPTVSEVFMEAGFDAIDKPLHK